MTTLWHSHSNAPAERPLPPRRRSGVLGFSLTEMIVVISVLGVLSGIAIESYGNLNTGAKEAVAREKVEMLNQAVSAYAQGYRQLFVSPLANQGDEMQVLAFLQYRNAASPTPGSPFVDQYYKPQASSSTADYRIQWTSNFIYQLLKPGQVGTGLKVAFDGSDRGTTPYAGLPPSNLGH